MQSGVDSKRADGREKLVTLVAAVVLLPRVSLDVSGQRGLDGERPETLATLIGLLVRMYTDVTHQVTWLLKLFCTVRALMPAHSIHL